MKAIKFDGCQEQWDEYVNNNENATIYNLYLWGEFFKSFYKLTPIYLAVYEKGNIVGVSTLILMRNHLFKKVIVSLPYFCTGGVLSNNTQVEQLLLKKIRELVVHHNCDYALLRRENDGNELNYDFVDKRKSNFVLQLDQNHERVFNGFEKQIRRRIRKGYKSGCKIDISKKYIDDFYDIYRINMRFLGSPVHKRSFYAEVLKWFPENYNVLVVLFEDKVIGAQLLSYYKRTIYLPLASSLREYNSYSPNHLLYWESIKYGCENGYELCDFGRSTIGSGPYVFKKQWNAQELPLNYCYFYAHNNKSEVSDHSNKKLEVISELWKRTPLAITNFMGPHLSKWLA